MPERRDIPINIEEQFSFMSTSFYDNPYPFYTALQQADPVHWSDKTKSWLVTRYDDVSSGLRDSAFSSKRSSSHLQLLSPEVQSELTPLSDFYSLWLMYMDEPDHSRLRRLINRPFSAESVERQVSVIQEHANNLLNRVDEGNDVDLLNDYAMPLGVSTIGNMLGLEEKDHDLIIQWSTDLVGFLGAKGDIEKGRSAQKTLGQLSEYLESLIAKPVDQVDSDLLQTLIAGEKQGIITKPELMAIVANVLIDGHEPIANTIANGVYSLLQHPDQMQLLRDKPESIESATEEIIRYEPAFQYSARTATEDVVMGDKQIRQGERVQFMLGAANRDAVQFTDPQRLDLLRTPNNHGSFGFGIHYCPGARLGRRTVQIGINTLLAKSPNLELTGVKPEWKESLGYRALKTLEVRK